MAKVDYAIRYTGIPAMAIYNLVGPYDFRDEQERRSQGGVQIAEKKSFYNDLESSVAEIGFRNPIVIVAGKIYDTEWPTLPEFAQREKLICPQYGGSRLWIGQHLNLIIPCIVCDFTGGFDSAVQLNNINEIQERFRDPVDITIKPHYVEILKGKNDA